MAEVFACSSYQGKTDSTSASPYSVRDSMSPYNTDQITYNQLKSSCCGIRVGNPQIYIPILKNNTELTGCQLWTGDQNDKDLLASEEYVLLDVQDQSRLVFNNYSNLTFNFEENLQILVPMDLAKNIGFTRLCDVGPVIEHKGRNIFILKKISSSEECGSDETILYYKDDTFSIKHTIQDDPPEDIKVEDILNKKFGWSTLLEVLKWPIEEFCIQNRLIIIMLICRFAYSWSTTYYYYNYTSHNESNSIEHSNLCTFMLNQFFWKFVHKYMN